MTEEILRIEIQAGTDDAEKQVDAFLKKVEKKLNTGLNAKIDVNGGESGRAARFKAQAAGVREQTKAVKELLAIGKQREQQLKRAGAVEDKFFQRVTSVSQKLVEAKQQALHQISRAEIQAGASNMNARRVAEENINRIITTSGARNLADIRRLLSIEVAVFHKANQMKIQSSQNAAAELANQQNHISKNMSRHTNTVFQVQQAIEDFSFAGFRGASNNIALIASQMGGPGGIIAMIGLMGLTMGPMVAKMGGWTEATDKQAEANDRFIEGMLRRNKLQESLKVADLEKPLKSIERIKDAQKELTVSTKKLDIARQQTTNLRVQSTLLNRMAKAQALESKTTESSMLLASVSGFTFNKRVEEIRLMTKELGIFKAVQKDIAKLESSNQFQVDTGRLNIMKAAQNAAMGYRDELAKLDGTLVKLENRNFFFQPENLQVGYKAVADAIKQVNAELLTRQNQESDTLKTLEDQKRRLIEARDLLDEQTRIKARLAGTESVTDIADTLSQTEREKESKFYREQLEFLQKQREELIKQDLAITENTKAVKAQVAQHREALWVFDQQDKLYDKAIDSERERLRIVERRNSAAEKETETLKKQNEQLTKSIRSSRNSFGDQAFDLNRDKTQEFTSRQAEQAKRMDRLRNPLISALGDSGQVRAFRDSQIDAYFKAVGLAKDHALVKERARFLKGQSKASRDAGDFDAERDRLKELQSLQMQQAANSSDPRTANKWFEAAKNSQKLIEDSFKRQKRANRDQIAGLEHTIKSVDGLRKSIEDLTERAKGVPPIDPVSQGAIDKVSRLADELARLRGEKVPNRGKGGGKLQPGGNKFAGNKPAAVPALDQPVKSFNPTQKIQDGFGFYDSPNFVPNGGVAPNSGLEKKRQDLEAVKAKTNEVAQATDKIRQKLERSNGMTNKLKASMDRLASSAQRAANAVGKANSGGKGGKGLGKGLSGRIPGLATGGPVSAHKPYIVGEEGPELFMPKGSGDILSNGSSQALVAAMANAGSSSVTNSSVNNIFRSLNINVNSLSNASDVGDALTEFAVKSSRIRRS